MITFMHECLFTGSPMAILYKNAKTLCQQLASTITDTHTGLSFFIIPHHDGQRHDTLTIEASNFSGHKQISVVHERIGTFRFEIERVFKITESGQLIEGSMCPLRDGQIMQEFPVPFAVIAECTTSNLDQFRSLRFYYDGRRVAEAVEKAELDS